MNGCAVAFAFAFETRLRSNRAQIAIAGAVSSKAAASEYELLLPLRICAARCCCHFVLSVAALLSRVAASSTRLASPRIGSGAPSALQPHFPNLIPSIPSPPPNLQKRPHAFHPPPPAHPQKSPLKSTFQKQPSACDSDCLDNGSSLHIPEGKAATPASCITSVDPPRPSRMATITLSQ